MLTSCSAWEDDHTAKILFSLTLWMLRWPGRQSMLGHLLHPCWGLLQRCSSGPLLRCMSSGSVWGAPMPGRLLAALLRPGCCNWISLLTALPGGSRRNLHSRGAPLPGRLLAALLPNSCRARSSLLTALSGGGSRHCLHSPAKGGAWVPRNARHARGQTAGAAAGQHGLVLLRCWRSLQSCCIPYTLKHSSKEGHHRKERHLQGTQQPKAIPSPSITILGMPHNYLTDVHLEKDRRTVALPCWRCLLRGLIRLIILIV